MRHPHLVILTGVLAGGLLMVGCGESSSAGGGAAGTGGGGAAGTGGGTAGTGGGGTAGTGSGGTAGTGSGGAAGAGGGGGAGAGGETPDADVGFPQPRGTVAVSFTVDDTANQVYEANDLKWKGAMIYDQATRKITPDGTWGGPWATLYDDGPWNAGDPPGHEPIGSVAGDHKWGVTVFATPPAAGTQTYEYGLNDDYYETEFGNGWVWTGANGSFSVPAGTSAPITAAGKIFAAFGTTDLRIVVDTTHLEPGTNWDTSTIGIKGSVWGWGRQTMAVAGTTATFTLSGVIGVGKPLKHSGLLASGTTVEFVLALGAGLGIEYKDNQGTALMTGVTAATKAAGDESFTPTPISVSPDSHNTSITTP